jgi:alpha-N-acetylglucosaminidase
MKVCFLVAVFVLGCSAGKVDPTEAVARLIDRVLPQFSDRFVLGTLPQQEGKDVMQLGSSGDSVVLLGSSSIALASAFNWYLNEFCNTTYDWNTYGPILPNGTLPLPPTSGTAIRVRQSKWSKSLV